MKWKSQWRGRPCPRGGHRGPPPLFSENPLTQGGNFFRHLRRGTALALGYTRGGFIMNRLRLSCAVALLAFSLSASGCALLVVGAVGGGAAGAAASAKDHEK